jgi:hypothetical protein
MRYYFSLFVFSVGALVLAAPKKPIDSVNKEDVQIGGIYWPLTKYLEPKDPTLKVQYLK